MFIGRNVCTSQGLNDSYLEMQFSPQIIDFTEGVHIVKVR